MSKNLAGGCLCGAVRYECSTEPVMAGNCHCRDCQRTSGSGYSPTFFVPSNGIEITGEVKFFVAKGDSSHDVSRGFCPICGSQVCGSVELMPGLVAIRAGTLDDPSQFKPAIDLYTSRTQPWDFMSPELLKFPQMPPLASPS
jgi:hypothetical protein